MSYMDFCPLLSLAVLGGAKKQLADQQAKKTEMARLMKTLLRKVTQALRDYLRICFFGVQ